MSLAKNPGEGSLPIGREEPVTSDGQPYTGHIEAVTEGKAFGVNALTASHPNWARPGHRLCQSHCLRHTPGTYRTWKDA